MLLLTTKLIPRPIILTALIKSTQVQSISFANRRCLAQKYNGPFLANTNLKQKGDKQKITSLGWFLLVIPITTFGLGCWQVKRKIWKENLIKELNEKTKAEPVDLPDNLEDLNKMEYCKIKVRGQFQHEKEMLIGPRSFVRPDGGETGGGIFSSRDGTNGFNVVTPFKLSGREEIILVNRGWVPRKLKSPESRKEGQITGEIELCGIVRMGECRPQFTPEQKGEVYLFRDIKKMCAECGADPYFIDADHTSSVKSGPIGGQTRITLRNDHLSYIITWFSLSIGTALLWRHQIVKGKSF